MKIAKNIRKSYKIDVKSIGDKNVMDNKEIAQKIRMFVGGEGNIILATPCSTRIRFKLKDKSLVEKKQLLSLSPVISVLESGGTVQVVLGTQVLDIYRNLVAGTKLRDVNAEIEDAQDRFPLFGKAIEVFSLLLAPVLGTIIGAGLLKGILMLLVVLDILKVQTFPYVLGMTIVDAVFYFLPVFIAFTAGKRFNTNPYISIAIAVALIAPERLLGISDLQKQNIFGFSVQIVDYSYRVIPIFLAIWFQSKLERGLKRIISERLKEIVMPIATLLIIVPTMLFFYTPLDLMLVQYAVKGFNSLYEIYPALSGAYLGVIWPLFVIYGAQWDFISLITAGNSLYNSQTFIPMLYPLIVTQGAATLMFAFMTKNMRLRLYSLFSTLAALMGVAEPAMYGINFRFRWPFLSALIGGIVATTLTYLQLFTIETNILFSSVVGVLVVVFFMCLFDMRKIGEKIKKPTVKEEWELLQNKMCENAIIVSPVKGRRKPLEYVGDEVFVSKVLGDGVAIVAENGNVYAPMTGIVTEVFATGHAMRLKSNDGIEILIHIGIDTIELAGKGFDTFVKPGQEIQMGQKIMKYAINEIEEAGYDVTFILLVTNYKDFDKMVITDEIGLEVGDYLLTVTRCD